jgi:putative molybdenum carrier protein
MRGRKGEGLRLVSVEKIVAGGQTGADRAALDVGLEAGLDVGGWVPQGRLAEDGPIPARYPGLLETESADVAERTRRNVRDADATLIISRGPLGGGSRLTFEEARHRRKPVLHLDVLALGTESAEAQLREWLAIERPRVLNVAGPRASEDASIYDVAATLLRAVLNRRTTNTPSSVNPPYSRG